MNYYLFIRQGSINIPEWLLSTIFIKKLINFFIRYPKSIFYMKKIKFNCFGSVIACFIC